MNNRIPWITTTTTWRVVDMPTPPHERIEFDKNLSSPCRGDPQ